MHLERPHQHTHTPKPQPGVAGRSRNPSPNTHTHTEHPCQEWLGASGARTRAHTQPNTPARSDGAQPKAEPEHTNPQRTPQPGVGGRNRNPSANTHTHTAHPCQGWLGASGARTRAHTQPNTPASSGGVQPKPEPKHTHPRRPPRPGVAGWAGRAPTPAHTQPNTPARSGGAQPKPEPKHTHPRRAPQPGVAGCKRSAHTGTDTPQHPSKGWRGATQNPSPNTHTDGAHPSQEWRGTRGARTSAHTQPNTPARSGGVQPRPEPKHTHPRRAPQPGVAGYKGSAHTSTHTAQHPS